MKLKPINTNSLLLRIRAADSLQEIELLLAEGRGYGRAQDCSIRRWRCAAKKRMWELVDAAKRGMAR